MKKLEYRFNDKSKNYPAIYHYHSINEAELICRMSCGFYVKEKKVYKVISNAVEPSGLAVIYVEEIADSVKNKSDTYFSRIGLEIRELKDNETIVIKGIEYNTHDEVLPFLHSDFLYVPKKGSLNSHLEIQLDSLEIDEDRNCYVFYGLYTGVELTY